MARSRATAEGHPGLGGGSPSREPPAKSEARWTGPCAVRVPKLALGLQFDGCRASFGHWSLQSQLYSRQAELRRRLFEAQEAVRQADMGD